MDKKALIDRLGAQGEERVLYARILDRAEQARQRDIPSATDFLSPQQQAQARDLLRWAQYPLDRYLPLGGYEGAERNLFFFLPDWMDPLQIPEQSPIRCLRAAFRREDGLSHRDFLGSLMAMGIAREKIGDLLVGEESADIVVADTVAEFLLQNWDSAGRAKLRLQAIAPECIHIPQVQCQQIRDTVSSLRLDAVVAAGLRMSRGRAAELIAAGRVQLDWRPCTKSDHPVVQGDTISARGFGKFQLAEVGGMTKKGRIAVVISRYL